MKGAVVISLKLKARSRYRDYNGTAVGRQEENYNGMQMPCVESQHSSSIAGQPMMGAPKSKSGSDGSTTPVADER